MIAPFRAIADFTYDWETWAGLDGKPHWVNPAVERITGYTAAECLAMRDYPLPLVHEHHRPMIRRCLRQAARGKSGNDVEFMILHRDGSIRWGAVSWQTIADETGQHIGYRTSVREITERKQAEDALRRAHEEAERANLAKSRFLAAASHDLRQPIQAIGMFASALSTAKDEQERAEIIEAIQESVHATDSLLNALLDVSRLDAGVMQPQVQPVAITDVLERIETEFAPQAANRNLDVRVVHSSAVVRSDPILVERVVRNLVSNAIRYTEKGRILVGCRRRRNSLWIEVWDTGIGIPENALTKIFEEFQQLNNPERDRSRGLGLGLAIVDRLSRLLGHKLDVRSVVGTGSVFRIELPLTKDTIGRSSDGADTTEIDLSGIVVLGIDDDPTQLGAMNTVFRHWNCRAITATSTESALEALKIENAVPDVIVADYRLRDNVTGAEAIQAVRAHVGRDVPAAILTGDTEPVRIAEATASGFKLLHKPISPETLKRTLKLLVSQELDAGA